NYVRQHGQPCPPPCGLFISPTGWPSARSDFFCDRCILGIWALLAKGTTYRLPAAATWEQLLLTRSSRASEVNPPGWLERQKADGSRIDRRRANLITRTVLDTG